MWKLTRRGARTTGELRTNYMINQNGDEFMEDDPLAGHAQAGEGMVRREGSFRSTAQKVSDAAGDTWEQAKDKAGAARERTEVFLRENPVPTILGALAVGLAIGLAIRYASEDDKKVEIKTPVGNWNWSFLTLPFLWPLIKSAREKYEETSDALRGSSRRLDIDRLSKPIRKRWKAWTD